jgi:hypothetical protein
MLRISERIEKKAAYRYAAKATSTALVELTEPTECTGIGQERAKAFITAADSNPAAISISETATAKSICEITFKTTQMLRMQKV